MFYDEDDATTFLRRTFPDFDDYEFYELVSLIIQDHAEETDTTEGWWQVSADDLRAWAENIVATCNF